MLYRSRLRRRATLEQSSEGVILGAKPVECEGIPRRRCSFLLPHRCGQRRRLADTAKRGDSCSISRRGIWRDRFHVDDGYMWGVQCSCSERLTIRGSRHRSCRTRRSSTERLVACLIVTYIVQPSSQPAWHCGGRRLVEAKEAGLVGYAPTVPAP